MTCDTSTVSTTGPRADSVASSFKVLDYLIKECPSRNIVIPNVAVAGEQSVGKSSLLSTLCNCPLWSSARTATHGPTQIHSRFTDQEFSATIEIEFATPTEGLSKKVAFTKTPISDKDGLAQVLQWAGDEARRSEDGQIPVRPYEELLLLSDSERSAGHNNWPLFTANVVILNISGIYQRNISIVDLPGIVTGPGEALSKRLARQHLAQSRTLILLCLAAGGGDPTMSKPEIRLVKECDPSGVRTIGIITKADQMAAPNDSAWGDLIAGRNSNFSGFAPAHKWWPVRLRTHSEYREKLSMAELIALQDELFERRDWQELADNCDRDFKWEIVSSKIYGIFQELVHENIPVLRKTVIEGMRTTKEELSKMVPEILDPVGELHDSVIAPIVAELITTINQRRTYSERLNNLHGNLTKDLVDSVPEFVPFASCDIEAIGKRYKSVNIKEWPQHKPANQRLYIDQIYGLLHDFTNFRTGKSDAGLARLHFLRHFVECWPVRAKEYSDSVWTAVDEAVVLVVSKVCKEKRRALPVALKILQDASKPFKRASEAFITEHCKAEEDDPQHVDYYNEGACKSSQVAIDHYLNQKDKLYPCTRQVATRHDGPMTPLASPLRESSNSSDEAPIINVSGPGSWSAKEIENCITLGTSVTMHLVWGANRISLVIGREIQRQVQKYLAVVGRSLRKGFDLEHVQDKVSKRSRELCDADDEVVARRKILQTKSKAFENLESLLNEHFS